MEKIKCAICDKELPISEFWKLKAPGRQWKNHKQYEKPYNKCKKCCETLINQNKLTVLSILKDLDIPFWPHEWNILQKQYPETYPLRRYIAKMYLGNLYGLGYDDTEYLNKKYGRSKIKVVAFVGKSGSGKDYLMHDSVKHMDWHIIVSSTTRPKRDYETEGVDYHFLTEKEFAAARFLETASFNGWHYGTRYEDLDPTRTNVGVFNPTGLKSLAAHDDIELNIIYVKASDKTRLLRQLNREEEPNVHEIVRRFYTDEADFQDDKSFINLGNSYHEVWNDDRVGQS